MHCVLHIGTEKTGTTLLQYWLYQNESNLSRNGIYLSESFGTKNNWQVPVYFSSSHDHYFLRKSHVVDAEGKAEFFADFDKRFLAELQKAQDHHTVLFTSEHFHSALTSSHELEALRDYLARHFSKISIICYFREQSSMAASLYSTAVKGAYAQSFDAFLETVRPDNAYFNHLAIADLWSDCFGIENCEFRPYDPEAFKGGDLRVDFLSAISADLDPQDFDYSSDLRNTSLSGLQAAVFCAVNQICPYWRPQGGYNPKNRSLKERILQIEELAQSRIASEKQLQIAIDFSESNRLFDLKYLRRNELRQETERTTGRKFRQKLEFLSDVLDYKIHKFISESSLATTRIRRKFSGPAERRRNKLIEKHNYRV